MAFIWSNRDQITVNGDHFKATIAPRDALSRAIYDHQWAALTVMKHHHRMGLLRRPLHTRTGAPRARSRARPQAHNTHMHPASCQLLSSTQQLGVQAHVPIFYSCGVIHMHLAIHRKVTQADADSCIRPSTYCCCIDSSKMWHTGVRTPLLRPRAKRP